MDRALPTETKVENGTSQSKRGTSVKLRDSEIAEGVTTGVTSSRGCAYGRDLHQRTNHADVTSARESVFTTQCYPLALVTSVWA